MRFFSKQGRKPVKVDRKREFLPGLRREGEEVYVANFSGVEWRYTEARRVIRIFGHAIPAGKWEPIRPRWNAK